MDLYKRRSDAEANRQFELGSAIKTIKPSWWFENTVIPRSKPVLFSVHINVKKRHTLDVYTVKRFKV